MSKYELHYIAIETLKESRENVLDTLLLLVIAACLYAGYLTDRLINILRRR